MFRKFSPARSVATRLLSVLLLCPLILTLSASPALAGDSQICPPDQTITVVSGEKYTIDLSLCSPFGLQGNHTAPAHGTITGLDFNGSGIAYYTNNGDGASSDSFTLQDEASNDIRFSVTILPANSPISVSPASLSTPSIGTPYSVKMSASGGVSPYTYTTTDTLPDGLTLASDGTISGTPTASDSFSFTVNITDSTAGTPLTATKNYSVTIAFATLTISNTPPPPQGATLQAYSHQFSTSGGTAPYTYVVESGSPPPGISVSPSGLMSGTPTATGDYNFVLKSTDATGGRGPYSKTLPVTVKVTAAVQPPVAGPVSVSVSTNSTANPLTLALSGGAATSVAVSTAASHGVATASGTSISYTPAAGFAGEDSFSYTATNTAGTSSPGTVTVTVNPVVPLPPTIGAVTTGNRQASVSFTPPANNGGSSITSYTVTSTPGNFTGSGSNSPITVSGLNNGTAYTFRVTATNAIGTGNASAASSPATPSAVPVISGVSPNRGPVGGGTSVTITGSGFLTATGLKFGNTAAVGMTILNDTQITATSPAGSPGTVDITVTVPGATSAISAADRFTYVAAPVVSSISTATGPTSGGTHVTITGTGFTSATVVTFGAAAAGFTVNSDTQITATSPAGTGTVNIQVTTPGGTSATGTEDQFTFVDVMVGAVTATVPYGSSDNTIALDLKGGSPTSVAVVSNPAHGSATASGTDITYTPTAGYAGADSFTYSATKNGITSASATVSITVSPPTQTVTPAGSWTATRGVLYTQTLTWSGGTTPYSNYTVLGLPSGLSVSNPTATSVTISGTPIQAGSFSVTFSARDSSTGDGPFIHPATFTLTVNAASALTLSPGATTFNATSGTAFSQTFTASGGLAPYTFAQTGTLPAGVIWNAGTATLTGEPTESGDFPFTITASDGSSGAPETLTQNYTLRVANEIPVAPPHSINSAGPGQPVEINLTNNATGGPFTAANLLSIEPANAGTATISAIPAGAARMRMLAAAAPGNTYSLRFVPNPDASGIATITYTLSNATSTSAPGVITISLSARSDPSKDAEVQGLINAQANSSRRFASSQIGNFQQRLEALHIGNVSAFSNGFSLTSASLQRQRQRQNQDYDPTGIEQWLQIRSAKLQAEQPLRASPTSEQTPTLGNQSDKAPASPLAFWTSGTISIGDDARGSSGNEQKFVTSGLSVGADYRWAPNLTLGVGFGYGHDKTDIGDNGSRSRADSYSVALYGSYRPTESTYLDAVLGYQQLAFDTRRYVTDSAEMVNGDRDGAQTFASLAAGYEYRQEKWLLSPYARLDLTHAKLDSYRERGESLYALSYDQQTVKTTSSSLGLRSEYAQTTAIGELMPSLRLEYQHDFQGAGDASMRYADLSGGTQYHINLDALGQDRGVFGLGIGLLTETNWSLRMEYQYTISSGAQKSQSMLFNLGKPF